MTTLSLNMKLYTDWKEPLTPTIVLTDLYKITQQIDIFFGRHKIWYLPGDIRQESLQHIAFDQQGETKEAIKEFEEDYTEENPIIIKGIWDGEDDDHSCSICYMNYRRDRLGQTQIDFHISIEENEFRLSRLINFINFLISTHSAPHIMIENNTYRIKRKHVFPDRLSAGWMLYLPIEIDPTLAPMAEEIMPVSDKNDKKGSLIITTKDIFDIDNQKHINKANDIEICLRDLQILPLITEI
ncbi:Imm52 family immunity protein [Photorhabdus aegyptia]|uniref:Imm52 family immunity protein n=1 Tax=Photorhabdus aegyptia TaxID=2805098 RepID=UPI001E436301|nr:Imm52 family immunity protein [Photorhabdus aegyptia]MCC8459968.1 immunity 52 family protein [Photorhabdus aegyptia]